MTPCPICGKEPHVSMDLVDKSYDMYYSDRVWLECDYPCIGRGFRVTARSVLGKPRADSEAEGEAVRLAAEANWQKACRYLLAWKAVV